jgi:hypothetical protein
MKDLPPSSGLTYRLLQIWQTAEKSSGFRVDDKSQGIKSSRANCGNVKCSRELTSSSDAEVQTLRNTAPKGPNVGTALAESDPAARVIVGSSTTWSALAASPKLRAGLADDRQEDKQQAWPHHGFHRMLHATPS